MRAHSQRKLVFTNVIIITVVIMNVIAITLTLYEYNHSYDYNRNYTSKACGYNRNYDYDKHCRTQTTTNLFLVITKNGFNNIAGNYCRCCSDIKNKRDKRKRDEIYKNYKLSLHISGGVNRRTGYLNCM